ncbi:MAG: hypothetical protein H5T76_16190 [Streptomyces sp.]|nr:hypothetical protein [Streptomyces sp.]
MALSASPAPSRERGRARFFSSSPPTRALFVAAGFSLTTVERDELERAAEAGERGADGA